MSNKQTTISKDATNKKIIVVREFDAPPEEVWKAWTDATYWISGGRQSPGRQKQKRWIFVKVVFGYIVWPGLMALSYGAVQIIKQLFKIKALLPKTRFVMKTET